MILGIVGSEAAKFTTDGRFNALMVIENNIDHYNPSGICSGGCHLGGVDAWAMEAAEDYGLQMIEFPATSHQWSAPGGYKERNLKIVERSDVVICITVDKLPDTYTGMKFDLCYHCGTKDHVKSGGCWTMKQAKKLGKEAFTIVVGN